MIDWVSVEELDWSAESQVLIPAGHFWCDFKCRPWAKNSSPNTNDSYIYYMDKSTRTPPSLEEKKALPNCGHKDGNIIHVRKKCISTSVATVLKCMKWLHPYFWPIKDPSHWCLVMWMLCFPFLLHCFSRKNHCKYLCQWLINGFLGFSIMSKLMT